MNTTVTSPSALAPCSIASPSGNQTKRPGPNVAAMRDALSLEHVHAVAAGMGVQRIDDARRIANEPHQHPRLGVGEELLAIESPAEALVEALFPRQLAAID